MAGGRVDVEVEQSVESTVPGRVGNWSYSATMRLPVIPRVGEWLVIELPGDGAGEHVEQVKDVFISSDSVHVVLRWIKTDNPEILDGLLARGWQQNAGPWAEQGVPGA